MRYSVIIGLTCLLALPASADCPPGPLVGEVTHVRDGDTIELGDMAIRLQGLAAPERGEPGAKAATGGERTHDRCVAACYLEGRDVAAPLVRDGLARDCPAFSGDRYDELEETAAADGAEIQKAYRLPGYCRKVRT